MKFVLEIELGNDAMRTRQHIAEALKKVASKLTTFPTGQIREDEQSLRDVNGNRVGFFGFKDE